MATWRAVVRVLRSPLDAASCAFFPSHCRICTEPLLNFSPLPVCADCWRNLQEQPTDNLCALCGEHLGWGDLRFSTNSSQETRELCDLCERAQPQFQQAVAYGVYEGRLRALIHLLKYERVGPIAVPLGKLLANSIMLLRDLPASLTIVAVPLHAAKKRERGFNQTTLLAEAAYRTLRRSHPNLNWKLASGALGRQRSTGSQSGLTARQRRLNLRGAFFVAEPDSIHGQPILLLDDIYTTGTTARECTKTLLAAGATAVYVATLARSQREGVALWNSVEKTGTGASASRRTTIARISAFS